MPRVPRRRDEDTCLAVPGPPPKRSATPLMEDAAKPAYLKKPRTPRLTSTEIHTPAT